MGLQEQGGWGLRRDAWDTLQHHSVEGAPSATPTRAATEPVQQMRASHAAPCQAVSRTGSACSVGSAPARAGAAETHDAVCSAWRGGYSRVCTRLHPLGWAAWEAARSWSGEGIF